MICKYFFRFLHNSCYKLSLGCNASHFLMIYFWRLIKNSYSTNKNLKKKLKLSPQILESHWSHSQSSNCLSKKNVANILKLAEKICHGWQSLCHTTVSKILMILHFKPIDSFDRHTFLVLSSYGAYFMILASGFHWIPWKRTWLIFGDWITT